MIMETCRAKLARRLVPVLEALRWSRYKLQCPRLRKALKTMPAKNLVYAINISLRYRYVYVDNPKTGCSSLKSALVELEVRDTQPELDYYDWRIFHNRGKSPLRRITDLPTGAPLGYLYREGYQFITFVRNPYTRVLSCYRDKILKNDPLKATILRLLGHAEPSLDIPVSFEQFVKAIAGQTDYEMNVHWRPQTSQTLYEILDYSFVGRFERYQEDFAALFAHLGIPEAERPPSRHLNRTREGAQEGCAAYYTPGIQELVHRRYRKDFENFGYPYELPE